VSLFAFRDVRTRLLVVVVATLALALAASTFGFNRLLDRSSLRDANALLRQRAVSERALLTVRGGRIVRQGTAGRLGGERVWVFDRAGRAVESAPARPETQAAAAALAVGPSRYVALEESDERLFSLPVVVADRRSGTIVVGVTMAPYEHTEHVALVASVAFAATLLVLVGTAAWWLLRSALRPVASMTEQAAAWVETDLDGRFRLGDPHDELTRLAWTLDQLLDRIAASLRHERLLSAELSHELRTPLAKLRAEAELALRRPRASDEYEEALRTVIAHADRIDGIVGALLAAAREDGGRGVSDAESVVRLAIESCAPVAAQAGVEVEVEPSPTAKFGVTADYAERVLHPVVDNACRYASSRVTISVGRDDGAVLVRVADDGPGVAAGEEDVIFEPARRGAAGRGSAGGAGLGLALARRLARSVAGDVEVADRAFVVRLPAA
jgi:signal transduction histidine kinase